MLQLAYHRNLSYGEVPLIAIIFLKNLLVKNVSSNRDTKKTGRGLFEVWMLEVRWAYNMCREGGTV